MKTQIKFILFITLLTIGVLLSACSTQKKCERKLSYIENHCPSLIKYDSLRIDTVIKERKIIDTLTVNVDTTGLDSLFHTVDSLLKQNNIVDTVYKDKFVKYIQYKYVNKTSNDSLVVDTNGIHMRAWLYDGRIYAAVSVDSIYINKAIVKKQAEPIVVDKFNWWKVYFFILLAITIVIIFKK